MTDTVTSPAGETIEVVSDDDWIALLGTRDARVLKGQPSRLAVIQALWDHGVYDDPTGFATPKLYADAVARGYEAAQSALNSLWHGPVGPAVEREVRGKRCFRIALTALPQTWVDELQTLNGSQPQTANGDALDEAIDAAAAIEAAGYADATDAIMELVDTPPAEPGEPADGFDAVIQLDVAQAVASALLAQVVDIVSTGKPDTARLDYLEGERARLEDFARDLNVQLEAIQRRLADALEYGQRSAREVRQLGDELQATKTERDGLRQRLRMAEANLSKAMTPANLRVVDELVHREVDKVMRAAPVHRAPGDDT